MKTLAATLVASLAVAVQAAVPITVGPTSAVGSSAGEIGLLGLWTTETDWLFAGIFEGLEDTTGTPAAALDIRLRDQTGGVNVVSPGIITLVNDPGTDGNGAFAYVNSVATRQLTETKLLAGDYWIEITATGGFANRIEAQLTIVPEPHEYALLGGVGLLGFVVYRRLRAA